LTQKLPVTLSQSMKGLFDRVLGHAKLARNFRLRRPVRFIREQRVQALEQRRASRSLRFVAQAREYSVEHGERPIAIINPVGAQHVAAIELAGIVRFDLVEGNQRLAAAAFDRRGVTALVHYEMLERSQKKGTQAALLLSH